MAWSNLEPLPGVERRLDASHRALKLFARSLRPSSMGAVHVTCSDEAMREGVETFHRDFVRECLPRLKPARSAAFRTANLGGRYEWGAIRIAEGNFGCASVGTGFLLMVVKIDAHVAVTPSAAGPVYGKIDRYGGKSVACGALHALLAGRSTPFAADLEEAFGGEGLDRLALLRNPSSVAPGQQQLCTALISARLQARRAIIDIQDHRPTVPTVYLVLAGVTLHAADHDRELIVGFYKADRTGGRLPGAIEDPEDSYCGLGDDPSAYEVRYERGVLHVRDGQIGKAREARDHRRLVYQEWKQRGGGLDTGEVRVRRALEEARQGSKQAPGLAGPVLRTLLGALLQLAPVPVSLALFASGALEIHHVWRAHRLARRPTDVDEARELVEGFRERLDRLPPHEAQTVLERLLAEAGMATPAAKLETAVVAEP